MTKSISNYNLLNESYLLCIFRKVIKKKLTYQSLYQFSEKLMTIKKLKLLYSAADIAAIHLEWESFVKLREAQKLWNSVISFSIGGLKDIVEHSKTGFLVKPFDTI